MAAPLASPGFVGNSAASTDSCLLSPDYWMKNEATIKSAIKKPATSTIRRKSAHTYWYSAAYSE